MLQFWKFSSLKLHSTSFWKLQSNVSAVLELSETLGNASWQSAPTATAMLQSQWGQKPCSSMPPYCRDHVWTGNSFLQGKLIFPMDFYFEGFRLLPVNLPVNDREAAYQQTRVRCWAGHHGWNSCPVSRGWARWACSAWRRDGFGRTNSSPQFLWESYQGDGGKFFTAVHSRRTRRRRVQTGSHSHSHHHQCLLICSLCD